MDSSPATKASSRGKTKTPARATQREQGFVPTLPTRFRLGSPQRATELRAVGVSVDFRGLRALSEVDVHLVKGRVLGLIGPNGAGKTTMLNVLTGFQRPTAGAVLLDGLPITRTSPQRRARLGMARTFQGTHVFGELSLLDNVRAGPTALGCSASEARDRAISALRWAALDGRAAMAASGLSVGEERRLGIARALAMNPSLILLDEPAAGLDDQESPELAAALRELISVADIGMLIVEHDMDFVMGLCDEILVLDAGRAIAHGDPTAIRSDPAVIRAYLGTDQPSLPS